jgi:hypothetical protein
VFFTRRLTADGCWLVSASHLSEYPARIKP